MTRNLKALGLILAAMFAMSAVAASAASAEGTPHRFFAGDTPVVVTGAEDTEHVFTYSGQAVKCKVTNFGGTISASPVTQVTITPTYNECEFNGNPATVNVHHCDYTFTGTTVEAHVGEKHAPVHVVCPEGQKIEVIVPALGNCTLTVGSQETSTGVTYKNEGEGTTEDITVKVTAQVAVEKHNPGGNFLCGLLPKNGTGTYEGSTTLKGYADAGSHTTETVNGETHWEFTEGGHVPIWFE